MFQRFSFFDRFIDLIENKKPSDRILLRLLFFVALVSLILTAVAINDRYVISSPTSGGVLVEGMVGIPRFVNPALAITRADQDSVSLIYSGLMKIDPQGKLIPDLADTVTVSEDGLTYTINLRTDARFHDDTPLSARDVLFTIGLIQDPDLKSPLRGNWIDVTTEALGEYALTITLREAYAPFIENFTFGIMPFHIWNNLPIEQLPFSQYNTEPIGSGPFMIERILYDASGLISGYVLVPAQNITSNLEAIELRYFLNETLLTEALLKGQILSTVFLSQNDIPSLPKEKYKIIEQPLPRVFAIFFNQNRSATLRDAAARRALNAAVNREELVELVLGGFGVPITTPIVATHRALLLGTTTEAEIEEATAETPEEILEKGGWRKNDAGVWQKTIDGAVVNLAVTIRTGNSAMFEATANFVADSWRQLGVDVEIEQYEQTGLVQSVIRSRDFEALLFGLDMNRLQDLYPFWHSSQKDDPGLNIAQYTNVTIDRLLETARTTADLPSQFGILEEVSTIIAREVPAIFLYAPSIAYVVDRTIETTDITMLGRPSDRFMNVTDWHARTDIVWPMFTDLK